MRKRQKKKKSESDKMLTVIALGTVFKGEIKEAGAVVIYGTVEGDIAASESLVITPSGVVQANITSQQIYIDGYVRGTLHTEILHLDSQARLVGDVHTRTLQISEGAVIQGSCSMPSEVTGPEGELDPLAKVVLPLGKKKETPSSLSRRRHDR